MFSISSDIDIMLANRVADVGPGLPRRASCGSPYVDALDVSAANDVDRCRIPDQKAFFAAGRKALLKRYYAESGVTSKPASLDDYLNKVVRATLERHKQAGAVAEKFEMAYLRTLRHRQSRQSRSRKSVRDRQRRLQSAAGLHLSFYRHANADVSAWPCTSTPSAGAGGYFNVAGDNPMLLEPLLNDPALRKTNFVLLHGGWPFERPDHRDADQAQRLRSIFPSRPSSSYPREVSSHHPRMPRIRSGKSSVRHRRLSIFAPEIGWEEAGYIAAKTGREASVSALTGMLRDGEISRERALELARMVLRENARKLYGLN